MFRALLTPLTARFDLSSPRFPSSSQPLETHNEPDDDDDAEDFARDVLIQLMRNSVESLKDADDLSSRKEILTEIERIINQDACTKPVFRELDGFLLLMSTLSSMPSESVGPVVEPREQVLANTLESMRLVFLIASEALREYPENMEYFKSTVGFHSFTEAMSLLVADQDTAYKSLGCLLGFALRDFSETVCDIFVALRKTGYSDATLSPFESKPHTIYLPDVIPVLWTLYLSITPISDESTSMARYGFFKLFERLCAQSHRNQAVLSSLDLLKRTFEHFYVIKNDTSGSVQKKERQIVMKLLRKLLEFGSGMANARVIFQKAIKGVGEKDECLDPDVLEVIRAGMKARWPEHLSLEKSAAVVLTEEGMKGLPSTGFTFMMWVWIAKLPISDAVQLFSVKQPSRELVTLHLLPTGQLQLWSTTTKDKALLENSKISKSRWTHITLVYYPHRSSNPTVRVFIDGIMTDAQNWTYPKADYSQPTGTYTIGDDSEKNKSDMSWCIASAHFLSTPLADALPRLIHHLGMRYNGRFQDPAFIRFLTYEAATSFNMFLAQETAKQVVSAAASTELTQISKALKDGLGIPESSILFSVFPSAFEGEGTGASANASTSTGDKVAKGVKGNIKVVRAECLDYALWTIGGAAVALRLVQLAKTAHELSRTLGILTDGLRSSWQNSEDMERLRGYEILAELLRNKHELINITGFETLFEFLGMNFRTPEQSTVVNAVAYHAVALDFELWSHTKPDIQRVHLEHFVTLLQFSKFKQFNAKRLSKIGLIRKLLFVLQTDWCQDSNIPFLIEAIKAGAEANFSKDDVIKPLVSYLAANLHEETIPPSSPRSIISRIDSKSSTRKEKAERILEMLISLLSSPHLFTKFSTALPVTRICLLLLGDRPTPPVAEQILFLISICLNSSHSFSRKFELVSGWSVLKTILPTAWDAGVNKAAFDILLGQTIFDTARSPLSPNGRQTGAANGLACPQILPSILCALHVELEKVVNSCQIEDNAEAPSSQHFVWTTEVIVENMLEQIIGLHTYNPAFRDLFRSQQTTQAFIGAYKSFASKLAQVDVINARTIRILEKMNHQGLALALDNAVSGTQKREILDILKTAESIVNPTLAKTAIDPKLVQDGRTVRQRFASARFSMQVGERTVIKTLTRMQEWRQHVKKTERKRLRKMALDLKENNRQVAKLHDWVASLTSERGLWPRPESTRAWRLDETEGPHRIRKKLEPHVDLTSNSKVDGNTNLRNVEMPDPDSQSVFQAEIPPWAEAEVYEISSTDIEDRQLTEEIAEDKHRRVRHQLEPGDVIEAVATVARIAGVDSSPGLFIFGCNNLYMLDGVVENDEGEIIDAHDAPRKLFFVPGSKVELDGPQRAQRWTHEQVAAFSEKTFLFRDVALEVYFKDSRSLLIVFTDKQRRYEMHQRLTKIVDRFSAETTTPGYRKTPLFRSVSARVLSGFRGDELSTAQRKWQAREISNFTYLSILNQLSGRTPSDATQYPVFPWVLQDYTSEVLDLSSPSSYRDLTKPMGALTEPRRQAADSRYLNLQSVDEKPFHYGTHFSSSMIVCHFLIRVEPFTHMFKTLQGGDWDLPDRLFSDVPRAYESAAIDVRGDVRELIPEFFTCPEFLENSANLDFGVLQHTGERIHDVKLPPWAKKDPLLFIMQNRQALESDYVSEHLPAWIDLIWGCKQRDPESLNVFHPLSYEGSIDLDTITDELEREATVGIIHNFGQTPRKLFTSPHPERYMHGLSSLPIGTLHGVEEDAHLLSQGARCIRDLGEGVTIHDIVLDNVGERIIPCPSRTLICPSHPHEQIQWDAVCSGGEQLRVLVDNKVVQVLESPLVTCAAFADSGNLVTGCGDNTVRLWRVERGSNFLKLVPSHIMRVHTDGVIFVTACRTWSTVISGSLDGTAALWDLNRGVYVRSIRHGNEATSPPIHLAAMNESTGFIATCSRNMLCLHTINARPIASFDLTSVPISSLAFHEREWSKLGILATGAPDGTITLRTWNADKTDESGKARWEFVTLRTLTARPNTAGDSPTITSLKFIGESLCHGEDSGKSYLWTLPD